MEINRNRILNLQRYIGHIAPGTTIRIIYDGSEDVPGKLYRAGFTEDASSGATILPKIVGRVTRFNAEGRWKNRKDLPKEPRFLYTRLWRRRNWQGSIHEEYYDVTRECYQRELTPPPSVNITIFKVGERTLIVSPELIVADESAEQIKHVINLMLELFRSCEIVLEPLADYNPPDAELVNWKFLPPGEYPWERLSSHLSDALVGASDDAKAIIQNRAEHIRSYEPDRILIGQGGFRDYIAYEFIERNYVILESIQRGNALYVFGRNWEHLSTLTKAQILCENLHEHRVVHNLNWQQRLAEIMN